MTKNAEKILSYINSLAACHGHPTAEEIFCRLRDDGERVSLATVYNSLNTLTDEGLIRRIGLDGEPDRYDRAVKHDHLVCKRCGKLTDARLSDFTERIEKELGSAIEGYDLKCYVLCEKCRKKAEKKKKEMDILCTFGKSHTEPNFYTEALERAGAKAVCLYAPVIGEKTEVEKNVVNPDDFDGLLLTGGGDVNPRLYGEENDGSGGIDDERDRTEIALIDAFVKAKKPIFGICRGLQILNVAFGGSLVQDLKTNVTHHSQENPPMHEVSVTENSVLTPIFGKSATVNSFHHQAIKECGKGLVVIGRSPADGTVEAVEHTSLPVYAVQWHPERMAKEDAGMQKLFELFCENARSDR